MPVAIRQVESRKDFRRFVKYPYRLHRDERRWIPPLIGQQYRVLNPRTELYFQHAELAAFLAERDGQLVGRVLAHIDHELNDFQDNKWGLFGYFDSEDDPEIAEALLGTAERWLSEHGRDRMVGPLQRSTRDDPGLLIEGYDRPPVIFEPWHPPYYRQLLEGYGLGKAMDAVWREFDVATIPGPLREQAAKWAARVKERHGVTVRPVRRHHALEDLKAAFAVIPAAFESSWGFVPSTEQEISVGLKSGRRMLAPATLLAERDGEVIGSSILLPDLNQCLAHMNGRLLPFGWAKFLYYRRRIDQARNMFMAIRPESRHLGIAMAFFHEHLRTAEQKGFKRIVIGFSWEDNDPMNLVMERAGAEVIIRHRIYEKELVPA